MQNATPDGYTLLVFSGSQHATVPAVNQATYEPVKGFSPITLSVQQRGGADRAGRQPGQSMAELHDWGRKKPGGLTFGTPGLGTPSHLLGAKILLADNMPLRPRIIAAARR